MTDRELLDMLQDPQRRNAGVTAFIRHYQRPIYFYIRRMVLSHEDADDISQIVFVKAWRAIDSF